MLHVKTNPGGLEAYAMLPLTQLHQVLVQLQACEKEQDFASAPIQVSISVQLWRLPGCHEFLAALLAWWCLSVDTALHHRVFGFFLLSSSWGDVLGASATSLNKSERCGNNSLASLWLRRLTPLLCLFQVSVKPLDLGRSPSWALAEWSPCRVVQPR